MIDGDVDRFLTEEFGEEKACEWELNQHVFVQRLSQNSTDEVVVWYVVGLNLFHVGVGVQVLVGSQLKETPVGVERSFE